MDVLDRFLALQFPNDDFSEKQRAFLQRYSIEKASSVNSVLTEIGEEITNETAYYAKNPHVKEAVQRLQGLYQKYNKPSRISGFGSFAAFLEWWCAKCDKGQRRCYYCGVTEDVCRRAFDSRLITSEKFTGELHIERKDPQGGYVPENCEFACSLCNNAKSDMISSDDFRAFFVPAFRSFWKHITQQLDK